MKQKTQSPALLVGQPDFQEEIWDVVLLNFEACAVPPPPTDNAASPTLLLLLYNLGGAGVLLVRC